MENKQFELNKRFVEFLNFNEKSGKINAVEILLVLEHHKIPLAV